MALNNEDKKDVQKHMGKALANKVSKVTRDKANHRGIELARKANAAQTPLELRRISAQAKLKANRDAKPRVSSMRKAFLE